MTRVMATAAMVAGLVMTGTSACEPGSEQRAREVGAEVQREAGVLAAKTRDGAGELVVAAGERTAEAAEAAGAWAGELVRSGQLSEAARVARSTASRRTRARRGRPSAARRS